VLVLLFGAYALVAQKPGCTEKSHYALVQALSAGTPVVDARSTEYCDVSYWHGRYYSNKAPGLAALALPMYAGLRALDAVPKDPVRAIWALNLWAAVLPMMGLLFLVGRAAERVEPGSGPLAAVTLGAATLCLPFATLFFSHVTAAALGFAAFMLLWGEHRGPARTTTVLAAGAIVGLSGTVEYPMAIFAVVLGGYAVSRAPYARRAVAFTAGAAAGILPLLVYNRWAFGSFTHLSYRAVVITPGVSGHDVVGAHSKGFFAISAPSFHTLISFFVEERGLLVLTPVIAAGAAGLWLLYRSPFRPEAIVALSVCALFLVYNAGFNPPNGGPFGGSTPGPRFLIPMLPFLVFPIGLAYRRAPGAVVALLIVSIGAMAIGTATEPFLEPGQSIPWLFEVRTGEFQQTLLGWLGAGTSVSMLPFFGAIALAALAAILSARAVARPTRSDVSATVTAVAAWVMVFFVARPAHQAGGDIAAVAIIAAGVTVAVIAARSAPRELPAPAPGGAVETPQPVS